MRYAESDMGGASDEVVLAASVDDPEQFVHLVRRYEAPFRRKARTIVRTKEDVEDVVQEAFTKIYLNAARFKQVPGASFKSWGYTILVHVAISRYRTLAREWGRTAPLTPEHYESLPDTYDVSFHLEVSDYVLSVLARMPEHLARVLDLHFLREVPQQEIAAAEQVSVGAIKTRVHRAKALFRDLAKHAPYYE